jgi:hypothetical protein
MRVASVLARAAAVFDCWWLSHFELRLEHASLPAFHLLSGLGAAAAAVVFHARGRRTRRWLADVRAGRVPGWRVRDVDDEDVLEMLSPDGRAGRDRTAYRDYLQSEAPAAVVSLGVTAL